MRATRKHQNFAYHRHLINCKKRKIIKKTTKNTYNVFDDDVVLLIDVDMSSSLSSGKFNDWFNCNSFCFSTDVVDDVDVDVDGIVSIAVTNDVVSVVLATEGKEGCC